MAGRCDLRTDDVVSMVSMVSTKICYLLDSELTLIVARINGKVMGGARGWQGKVAKVATLP